MDTFSDTLFQIDFPDDLPSLLHPWDADSVSTLDSSLQSDELWQLFESASELPTAAAGGEGAPVAETASKGNRGLLTEPIGRADFDNLSSKTRIDTSTDISWLDAGPFSSPGSTATVVAPTDLKRSLSLDASDASLDGGAEQARPPSPTADGALRASKRHVGQAAMATISAVPVCEAEALATTTPAVAQAFLPAQAGHVVRMMPVWMMPTAQHPQGRMVMMPVHFLPRPGPAALAHAGASSAKLADCADGMPGGHVTASCDGAVAESKAGVVASKRRRTGAAQLTTATACDLKLEGAHGGGPSTVMPGPTTGPPFLMMPARRRGGGGTLPPFASQAPSAPPPAS